MAIPARLRVVVKCREHGSTLPIRLLGDSLQMIWVHTMASSAKMIQFQPIRYGTLVKFVTNTMCKVLLMPTAYKDSSIPSVVFNACPFPTVGLWIRADVLE